MEDIEDKDVVVVIEYSERQGAFHYRELRELYDIKNYVYGEWLIIGPLPIKDADLFVDACCELREKERNMNKKLKLKDVRYLYDNYLQFVTGLKGKEYSIVHKIMSD